MMSRRIKLALIGGGVFTRDAHVPSLLALADVYEIVAVYSRTAANAAAIAERFPNTPRIYTDLAALLADPESEAVDIVLPIPVLADTIRQALAAGKHVISEKPIAATIHEARELLTHYDQIYRDSLAWMVAENWRFEAGFLRAGEIVQQGQIGKPLSFGWNIHVALTPENKYYGTTWRRDNSFPDGFLRDGGVHHIAAIRMILGEIASVSAHVAAHRADLPPLDTLSATLQLVNGAIGTYSVTYAAGVSYEDALTIAGERGLLRAGRREIEIRTLEGSQSSSIDALGGVQTELAAFADILSGKHVAHDLGRGDPREALADLTVIQAMVDSAHSGQRVEIAR